jgi:D-xylose 1-dehydrogenase (NADP+, D-xylono-1,5-lactone-forming)
VHAIARWAGTGVDLTLAGTLEFDSGLIAQIASSFATGYHRHAQISGDAGSIETMYLNHPPMGGRASFDIRRGALAATSTIETIPVPEGNGFLLEAESFARMINGGAPKWNGATPDESIDIALTLEALLKSARTGQAVDVGA